MDEEERLQQNLDWKPWLQGLATTAVGAAAAYALNKNTAPAQQYAQQNYQPMPLSNTGYEYPVDQQAYGYSGDGFGTFVARNQTALILVFGAVLAVGLVLRK